VRIAVLQPSYLPWLGYFDQMARTDAFVFYDDVQFDKNGWRNRNRIRTAGGQGWQWLTVPVLTKGRHAPKIREVEINNTEAWRRKHLASLTQEYGGSPFFKDYIGFFEEAYGRDWSSLRDLCVHFIRGLCGIFGIGTPVHFSSEIGAGGARVERLVAICERLGADEYLTGDAAEDYLTPEPFDAKGIRILYQRYQHPEYSQQHRPFVSHLSAVDLLFNCGPASLGVLCHEPRARHGVA
jgi:hypothetical protein